MTARFSGRLLKTGFFCAFMLLTVLLSGQVRPGELEIADFQPVRPIYRAGWPCTLSVTLRNRGGQDLEGTLELILPPEVRLVQGNVQQSFRFENGVDEINTSWTVVTSEALRHDLAVLAKYQQAAVRRSLSVLFLPALSIPKNREIPPPQPVATDILVGAHNCPLWETDRPEIWRNLLKHPERTPALGFYGQENPEVADWETKWAVEHGISFFVYCWYRARQGGPVEMRYSSALHEAFFHSRFQDRLRFAIMWENQARGQAGVADERDFLENLLPFWIKNYFQRPNYLVIDGKPLLFIYRPEFLVDDLGGVDKVASAFEKARQLCRQAGFAGLYLLGEYRGTDARHLQLMKDLGLDYTFAYVWPVPNNPTPRQAIEAQLSYITRTQELGIIPQVITVSQGWSGWQDEGSIWKLPPQDFEELLRRAKALAATFPREQLGSRLILLDNWNEWGEGHYIAPHREFGFEYLDAVRRVFSTESFQHIDLLPEDVGLGPYDAPVRQYFERERALIVQARRRITLPGTDPALVAWWAFDEPPEHEVAFDYSGHRLGGVLHNVARVKGRQGWALDCHGGCVIVPMDRPLTNCSQLTVECWVRTETPNQNNRWIVNCVFGGVETTGFRVGLLEGKPCFQIPVTPWSHHLVGQSPLPVGPWVHLAATFDGSTMRLYMQGREIGVLERRAPITFNSRYLVLGNYEKGHSAHFTGAIDEVRIYSRCLSPEEIAAHARPNQP
ncbi:MAG: LamG-like jellyroll fold domain-containing protein [Thermogutta sp.]